MALALFDEAGAQTPLLQWTSERVNSAASNTPDLDTSAVIGLYRHEDGVRTIGLGAAEQA